MAEALLKSGSARRLRLVVQSDSETVVASLPDVLQPLAANFRGKPGQFVLLPSGAEADALFGMGKGDDPFALGAAPFSLPEGNWTIDGVPDGMDADRLALAWAMGSYAFTQYKDAERAPARLVVPHTADFDEVSNIADSVALTRDLINTPADLMGPVGLEAKFRELAGEFGADCRVITGDALLEENYPLIHAVGRAAAEEPRLLELEWGDPAHPRLALVGKGVCFDTGGLNIKTGTFMRLMKKDMGGGATAMGLARMIMQAGLPVRLHLLVPAVENGVSAGAMRPGDIIRSRKGLTVEVDNTDAEGRLVLADALAKAGESECDLILDFATLTGAARVALGPELAPYYTADEDFASAVFEAGKAVGDPMWRMPLWDGYDADIAGDISDIVNSAATPMGGSITAALFLRRFVDTESWAHFDIFGWNPISRPGRPKGGEMLGARAVYQTLKDRYLN